MAIDPNPLYPYFVPYLRELEIEHLQSKLAPLLQKCMDAGSSKVSRRSNHFNHILLSKSLDSLSLSEQERTIAAIFIMKMINIARAN